MENEEREYESNKDEEQIEDETESNTTVVSYHTEDFISRSKSSKKCTVPIDILKFDHSFGYDCQKRFNLCVADPDTLLFASGNLIHFFKVSTNKLSFRRCSTGGGIGHITKNPMFDHIAIGENGIDPPIIIYKWPSMEIVTVLHHGTTRCFSHLRYSPDGLQLVSQGGDPDYLITVWDWEKCKIALQCKSYGQDVYNVVFSRTMGGHMTSCGSGHIKCWKMVNSFTGLKLQGELGRFGKTEISDIVGVYPMPDEKIISGCEWGNILVWDEGLIKIEVFRKHHKPCHTSYISQFEYINGELISVGTDGFIRVWYYETIDQAEPSEDSNFIEVEPIYEFSIGGQPDGGNLSRLAMLMQIQKRDPSDLQDNLWYAQDGNGGIWLIDLSISDTPIDPVKLLTCHAGRVMDMDVADWGPYAATIGTDGCLNIYDYREKYLALSHQFRDTGHCVVWLPSSVEPSGSTIVCAFHTGVIRMVAINLLNFDKTQNEHFERVKLTQVSKPHTKTITCMTVNPTHSVLVTGSEDSTIFVFQIKIINESYPSLVPIGYIELPSAVTVLIWKPNQSTTVFVGCSKGDCVQVNLPEIPQTYTTVSYKLNECEPIVFKFESVKSSILRDEARLQAEWRRTVRIAELKEELRQMLEDNPGIEIEEDLFIEAGLEEEEALPDIYIPEVPNKVLTAFYSNNDTLVLTMSGYDAGYIYEYSTPEIGKNTQLVRSTLIANCGDEEIFSYLFINDRRYIVLGMEKGGIRVCKLNPDDETDWSDFWILPMHDNFYGQIPKMCLSFDNKMLLSCGYDGNIFSYVINDVYSIQKKKIPTRTLSTSTPKTKVLDIEESDYPSLEQVVVEAERSRIMSDAQEEKNKTLAILHELTDEYNSILKRNQSLPPSQRLSESELELDRRITDDLNEELQEKMDIVYKKLERNVEISKLRLKKLMDHFIEPITHVPFAIKRILKPDTMVYSLRELKLTGEYAIDRTDPSKRLDSVCRINSTDEESNSANESIRSENDFDDFDDYDDNDKTEGATKLHTVESFLKGLSPATIQFQLGEEINQMLKKYRSLKSKLEEHELEWKILQSQKPDPKAINPDDEAAIENARNTIGNYNLKTSLNLNDKSEDRPTVSRKFKQIVDCRRLIHYRRENFNEKLRDLRSRKVELLTEVEKLIKRLKNIQSELPEEWAKELPKLPIIDSDIEFPENHLKLEAYTSLEDQVKETKKRRHSTFPEFSIEDFDEEYEVLLLDENHFRPGQSFTVIREEGRRRTLSGAIRTIRISVPTDVIAALDDAEKVDTELEREMKRSRAIKRNHEQAEILSYINKNYEAFDEELDDLEKERLEIVHESVYMDLHLLTMHQELIILKKFESMEKELTVKVKDKVKSKETLKNKIYKLNVKINEKNAYISKVQDKIKENLARYVHSIQDDKFQVFLKRICKKKYKQPKKDDESSSESSSSESSSDDSEQNDDGSEDSRDLGPIHLDENICPEGCSRDLYDEAFVVRERRYDMEQRIRDEQRSIEYLQKELDTQRRVIRETEQKLQDDSEKLDAFLREKQRQLNDIDVTVILKMNQLQCFLESDKAEEIRNCVVFDKSKLSRLYARVGELQQETTNQLEKHKHDKMHLQKMKTDCETMKQELERLKEQIRKEMEQKFGQRVSLLSLYEAVLRRLIYDIKANTSSLIKFYDEKIKNVKDEYKQQLQILKDLIQDNTEKLSFMTVLEEELLKLRKNQNTKLLSEEEIKKLESQYETDLVKLKGILRNQEEERQRLCEEIIHLTCKKSDKTQ